ncbi:LamG-like jellyroll fold domain-containing protein [Chitinophagaceae bacterium MMS25-I14]
MLHKLKALLFAVLMAGSFAAFSQTLPGDSVVYGPMMSAVYGDTVRVWVMTKNSTGSGNSFSLELKSPTGSALTGALHDSDTRLGYNLRSYLYTGLAAGQTYTATIKVNGAATYRHASVTCGAGQVTDFSFLAGGCGRIMDMTRCVDNIEGPLHINGTPDIYKHMATENSDMMVWLGDAVYLFGLEHAQGMCPGMINDWDTKDALFSRYFFNRQFHDTLLRAMPQLVITDNHDLGGNEYNKTMPTLGISKENFRAWWQNPAWMGNAQGDGLYSSYRYKDVEFFLLDNRSYRESTTRHLGPYQLRWLEQALLNSTASFKVLISGTPSFDKHWGGRNFSITTECDTLIQYIKAHNIDGVLCYSADIHAQEFFGRYNDHTYPFFDVLSGNLASDIGSGSTSVTPDNDDIFDAIIQTYTKTNIYGQVGDRRYKINYLSPNGVSYYSAIIHEDMLKSIDDSTKKIALAFTNTLTDSSKYHRTLTSSNISYTADKDGNASSAMLFGSNSSVTIPHTAELDMNDRTFSIVYWINPAQYPVTGYAGVFSNSTGNDGYTVGMDDAGHPVFINHANGKTYTASLSLKLNHWTHITWKYDNIKLQLMLCWNSQQIQKWTNVATPAASTGNLYLGTNVANKHFIGALDEFNTYGKLITDKLVYKLSGYQPHRGTALGMPGAQNAVIPSTEINSTLSGSTGFTVEFWERITAAQATGNKLMSCNGRVNGNSTGFSLEFSAAGKVNLAVGTNGSGWTTINDNGNPWQAGEWNHVALTAVPGDSLYVYVNGIKTGTAKFTSFYTNTFGLALGKSVYYGAPIQGEMDELRIWNAPQTGDSIRKRMHYTLSGAEANLAYYYNFNKYTDTTVMSSGAHLYELKIAGSTLVASTAPAALLGAPYHDLAKGNWSVRKDATTGLKLDDAIPDFVTNLVAGRHIDSTIGTFGTGGNQYYLKGGWQLDALNLPTGTITIDLSQCLPHYDSISHVASEFYLLKEDSVNAVSIVNNGYFDGQNLKFIGTFFDSGVYHLGWKTDTASALFNRGGVLSMLGGHSIRIPYAGVTNVLNSSFTIEFWGRLMQNPSENAKILSNNGRVNNNSTGISLEFPLNKTMNAVFGNNGSGWTTVNSKNAWKIGEWNHIAVTATPNDYIRLYMNGELTDSTAYTAFAGNQIDMTMGTSLYYGSETVSMLDELRIWKKVKTADEIRNQMHLTLNTPQDTMLAYNYTFNQANTGFVLNKATAQDSIPGTNYRIIPATSPVGNIIAAQQYHVTGTWSIRDSANSGLSVFVSVPDYETNLVMGKDSLTGTIASTTIQHMENLRTQWQIDPLKLASGQFEFDGPGVLGSNWAAVKNQAIEYYLLERDSSGQYVIKSVGQESNDKIDFNPTSLEYGMYTLGWKNNTTGIVEIGNRTVSLFPNPSNEQVTLAGIDGADVDGVYVHTITGQYVDVPVQTGTSEIRMNVGRLAPGTYIIVVSTKSNHDKKALKFIKQ